MTSRIRIYDKWGELETIIENIPTTPREYVINGYGRCEFAIPLEDPRCISRNFEFGNFIHIEHVPTQVDEGSSPSGKLPDWAGVILPNRTWNSDAVVITAYSVEALLAYRAMPYITVSSTLPKVFREIISYCNNSSALNSIHIQPGWIADDVSTTYSDDLKTNAFDHLKKMITATKMQWRIRPVINPSSYALELYADFLALAKTTKSALLLSTLNTEKKDPLMLEQGTIINDIFARNQAITEADRQMQELRDEASISKYGPFQANQVFIGKTSAAGINELTTAGITIGSKPQKKFSRTALDYQNTFDYLYLGNVLQIDEPNVGFNDNGTLGIHSLVRITSMSYNDTVNKVVLTIEVIE